MITSVTVDIRSPRTLMSLLRVPCIAAILLTLFATASPAQVRGGRQAGRGEDGQAPPVTANDIQQMLDAYEALQAQRQRQLSDDQYPQFLARLKVLQDTRRRSEMRRRRLLMELRRLIQAGDGKTDEGPIRDGLTQLQEFETTVALELQKAREGVDRVLDIRQQARFRLLEEQIEQRKLDLLTRVRAGRQRNQQ